MEVPNTSYSPHLVVVYTKRAVDSAEASYSIPFNYTCVIMCAYLTPYLRGEVSRSGRCRILAPAEVQCLLYCGHNLIPNPLGLSVSKIGKDTECMYYVQNQKLC